MGRNRHTLRLTGLIGCCLFVLLSTGVGAAQTAPNPKVNPNAAIISDFDKRIAAYMKLHQQASSGVPARKTAASPDQISRDRQQLCSKIRELRPQTKQGDIFTPPISALFRRLMATAMNGPDGEKIQKSYQRAEPAAVRNVKLTVNQEYPDGIPLQSMPPSLLLNLPKLPKELEYRFVGGDLVLHDIAANLIVDMIPDVTTPEKK